jgi:hypothetical protein
MIAFGIAVIAGAGNVKASQRTGLTLLLLAQGIAAGAYSAHLVRLRKKAPLVSGE